VVTLTVVLSNRKLRESFEVSAETAREARNLAFCIAGRDFADLTVVKLQRKR